MTNPDEPVINPKDRLAAKGVSSNRYDFPIALFSCFKGMADIDWWLAHSKAYGAKRIVHDRLDESYSHWGKIIQWPMSVWNIESDGLPIVFVGPILGGTWCAIALEELRALGLKYVIGISSHAGASQIACGAGIWSCAIGPSFLMGRRDATRRKSSWSRLLNCSD